MKNCTQIFFLTILLTAFTYFYFLDTIVRNSRPAPELRAQKHDAPVLTPEYEAMLKDIVRRGSDNK